MTALTLREVKPEEAVQVQRLAERIWPMCFNDILTPEQIGNMLVKIYDPDALRAQMAEGQRFWIASLGEQWAGYVSAYREAETIWLKKLYCEQDAQGKGVGTALMEEAVRAFLPATEIKLLVNRDNVAAQAYYERKGFARTGEVPVMMGDFAFVDYIYRKELKPANAS